MPRIFGLLLLSALLFAACGDGVNGNGFNGGGVNNAGLSTSTQTDAFPASQARPEIAIGAPRPADGFADEAVREQAAEQAAVADRQSFDASAGNSAGGDAALQITERQVIRTAFVIIRSDDVSAAATTIRTLAETAGGFVQQLSISGEEGFEQASLTVRIPREQFFDTLDRIAALGEVLSQDISTQDVTDQFIDLEARLNALTTEEGSLFTLLGIAESVTDILTIERELARIRADIERLQGQLNFLENRVAMSTITITLFGPESVLTEPPRASLTVATGNVARELDDAKALVERLEGVIDRVFIVTEGGDEQAFLSARLPRDRFAEALAALEDSGRVVRKQLEEGDGLPPGAEPVLPKEPDAQIEFSLIEKAGGSDAGLIAAIVAPIGGVLLLAIIVAIVMGRRRRA